MTLPRASKPWLIWTPSENCCPTVPVSFALSLPANAKTLVSFFFQWIFPVLVKQEETLMIAGCEVQMLGCWKTCSSLGIRMCCLHWKLSMLRSLPARSTKLSFDCRNLCFSGELGAVGFLFCSNVSCICRRYGLTGKFWPLKIQPSWAAVPSSAAFSKAWGVAWANKSCSKKSDSRNLLGPD